MIDNVLYPVGKTRTVEGVMQKLVWVKCCVECGATSKITVHHIDGNHANNIKENRQNLCRHCHKLKRGLKERKAEKCKRYLAKLRVSSGEKVD